MRSVNTIFIDFCCSISVDCIRNSSKRLARTMDLWNAYYSIHTLLYHIVLLLRSLQSSETSFSIPEWGNVTLAHQITEQKEANEECQTITSLFLVLFAPCSMFNFSDRRVSVCILSYSFVFQRGL